MYAKASNTKVQNGKPFWTLIRPTEARQLASFLLWCVAVQNKEADRGAKHVNQTYGLTDRDLDLLNRDLKTSATPSPDDEDPEVESPPKKKKTTK